MSTSSVSSTNKDHQPVAHSRTPIACALAIPIITAIATLSIINQTDNSNGNATQPEPAKNFNLFNKDSSLEMCPSNQTLRTDERTAFSPLKHEETPLTWEKPKFPEVTKRIDDAVKRLELKKKKHDSMGLSTRPVYNRYYFQNYSRRG